MAFSCLLLLGSGCFSTGPEVDGSEDVGSSAGAARCITPEDGDRLADQVLQLINLEREQAGLAPVANHSVLAKIASDFACRMVEGGFFAHRDPETDHGPGERAVTAKYSFYSIGENLAAGQDTPAEVMGVWMESPSHRDIILDPKWKEVGIGVRGGGEHSIYWVQEFGDPARF